MATRNNASSAQEAFHKEDFPLLRFDQEPSPELHQLTQVQNFGSVSISFGLDRINALRSTTILLLTSLMTMMTVP